MHQDNYFNTSKSIDFDSFEESNKNLHELFDSANDLIQVFSLDEKLLFANAPAVKSLKYAKNKIDSYTLDQIIHPDHLPVIREYLNKTKNGGSTPKIDTSFLNTKGQKIPVVGNFNCIFEIGKPVCILKLFRIDEESNFLIKNFAESNA